MLDIFETQIHILETQIYLKLRYIETQICPWKLGDIGYFTRSCFFFNELYRKETFIMRLAILFRVFLICGSKRVFMEGYTGGRTEFSLQICSRALLLSRDQVLKWLNHQDFPRPAPVEQRLMGGGSMPLWLYSLVQPQLPRIRKQPENVLEELELWPICLEGFGGNDQLSLPPSSILCFIQLGGKNMGSRLLMEKCMFKKTKVGICRTGQQCVLENSTASLKCQTGARKNQDWRPNDAVSSLGLLCQQTIIVV